MKREIPPFTPSDPGSRQQGESFPMHRSSEWWANALLRIAVLIYAVGLAAALFTRAGSALGNIALMDLGWAHGTIFLGERIAATLVLLAALSVIAYPTCVALLFVAALTFAEGLAAHHFLGNPYAEYTPLAYALRYTAPLALIPLVVSKRIVPAIRWRRPTAAWVLRVGIATVFVIHGLEALWLHPGFIDLIIGSFRNVLGIAVSESNAGVMLRAIGVADIALAVLLVYRPWPPILIWMSFWGLLTALSRPLSLGLGSYPEVLLRASHVLAPIALWLLYHPRLRR